MGAPGYRARMHSPLTMEEVLVTHPKLRVYLMHAGWPMVDDLLAVMYAHPQVHVDVGVMPSVVARHWTAAEVRALPDESGKRFECVDGELLVSPSLPASGRGILDCGP